MDEFPPNSHKARLPERDDTVEQSKKVEKVVEGDVIRRKKPLGKRFSETFLGGDAKGVAGYVLFEVIIPAVKDTVADAGSQAIERMLFGEARSASRRTGARPGSGYTNYTRYSGQSQSSSVRREEPRTQISRRARSQHDFDEIILATRAEAEEVIDRLFSLIEKYDTATVADLYEMVGITGNFTDDKWGWTDFRGAGVTRIRNGYLLDLPKPEPLS